jgi:SOS-response transcriptional repressor LexA
LTPRESDCLRTIRDLTSDGVPPSFQQIADVLGMASKSGVSRLLNSLRAQGVVWWNPDKPRSLIVLDDQVSPVALTKLSDATLRRTMAFVAGILAQREQLAGGSGIETAKALRNIADRLTAQPRRAA